MSFLAVGAGGALGAVCRYALSLLPYKGEFPLLTLVTNLLGAVLIGSIVGFAQTKALPQWTVMFLKTGFCGGFTTFSTFSLEAYQLFEKGEKLLAALYVLLSIFGCILGIWLGMKLSAFCVPAKAEE